MRMSKTAVASSERPRTVLGATPSGKSPLKAITCKVDDLRCVALKPVQGPLVGFASAAEIMSLLDIPESKEGAVKKRLQRWRRKNLLDPDAFYESEDRELP